MTPPCPGAPRGRDADPPTKSFEVPGLRDAAVFELLTGMPRGNELWAEGPGLSKGAQLLIKAGSAGQPPLATNNREEVARVAATHTP